MSHPKGRDKGGGGAPPITTKGRGWGQIMLMCRQSVCLTTIILMSCISCVGILVTEGDPEGTLK